MVKDTVTGWREADVTINGATLTFAQAMSLRVAVSSFRLHLHDPAFREGLGPRLADGYDAHLAIVEQLLIGGQCRCRTQGCGHEASEHIEGNCVVCGKRGCWQ